VSKDNVDEFSSLHMCITIYSHIAHEQRDTKQLHLP